MGASGRSAEADPQFFTGVICLLIGLSGNLRNRTLSLLLDPMTSYVRFQSIVIRIRRDLSMTWKAERLRFGAHVLKYASSATKIFI